jgi:preprotein translocase subunit SecG
MPPDKETEDPVNPLIYLVMTLHVLFAIGLILFVLLHSGKGTGLSSMFGGAMSDVTSATVIERNLDRITIGLAVGFTMTSLILMLAYRP